MATVPASPTTSTTPPTPTTRTSSSSASVFDRLLPQDLEAERAVLGSMLQEKEAIGEVIGVLREAGAKAFARESHQELYEVLVKFYVEDKPIDSIPLKDELVRRELWEKIGGFDFLAGLLSAVPSALRAGHYAGIVYEKYLLRQLIGATHRVMERALDSKQPTKEVLDFAEKQIFDVTERRVSGEAQELSVLVQDAYKMLQRRGEDALTGEPTGFTEFDQLTCGLQPGELIIVAGRPSMGKTALGLNMAEHLAIVERRGVLFFSLEMSRQQVAQRILCSRARVNARRLRRGRHSMPDMERLRLVAQDLADAPLLVDDTSDLTILELRARARMAFRRHEIRAIFVDYLQLMRAPRTESRQLEVATISRGLKALAKDLNVPLVAMAQLNRSPEDKSRRGNRPRMSDLRESGAIEQDADVIALLHREYYYRDKDAVGVSGEDEGEAAGALDDAEKGVAELIIDKQRNGPTGKIKLHWNEDYTRFDNHMPGGPAPRYVPADESPDSPF